MYALYNSIASSRVRPFPILYGFAHLDSLRSHPPIDIALPMYTS